MANRFNTTPSTNLTTALGAVSAGDSLYISEDGPEYSAGMDLTGVDITLLHVGPQYTKDLGYATALKVNADQTGAGKVWYAGSGRRIKIAANSSSMVIANLWHTPARGDCVMAVESAGVPFFLVNAGAALVAETVDMDDAHVVGNAQATFVAAGSTPLANLFARGRSRSLLQRGAGVVEVFDAAELALDNAAITYADVKLLGEQAVLRALDFAVISDLEAQAGHIDFSHINRPITITAATIGDASMVRYTPPSNPGLVTWSSNTYLGTKPFGMP